MKFQVNTEDMSAVVGISHDTFVEFLAGSADVHDDSFTEAMCRELVAYLAENYVDRRKTERPDHYTIGQQWANGKDAKETVWQVDNVLDSGEALCSKVQGDFTKDRYRILPAGVSKAYRFIGTVEA